MHGLKQQARVPSQPEDEGPVRQQLSESDGCYTGGIKFGLAHLKDQTVPTIHKIIEEFPQCKKIGFCKVTVGKDVFCDIKLQDISGSRISKLDGLQSKTVHLSPLKKADPLYGLACSSFIDENDQAGSFRVPSLSRQYTSLDPRDLFLSTVRDARKGEGQSYLVMPTESCQPWLKSVGLDPELLDCGGQLKKTASWIPGVHTAYLYISASRGSNSPLHVEDGFLGSINIVLAGAPKVWLMVEPCYRNELERKARNHLAKDSSAKKAEKNQDQDRGQQECSQFVRHLSTLLSPELLDSWEIPYRIISCEAGEMIVTFSETYHQVVNDGPNLAMAINFAEPGWDGPPEEYRFCNGEEEECGAHSITSTQLRIEQSSCDSGSGSMEKSLTENQMSDSPLHSWQKQDLDLPSEEVDEAINVLLEDMPGDPQNESEPFLDRKSPEVQTPPQPPSTPGQPEECSSRLSPEYSQTFTEPRALPFDPQTPLDPPETPGAPEDYSVNAQTPPGLSESPSALGRCSSETRAPSKAPETPRSSNYESCAISTPPTVLTEPEAQYESKADYTILSSDDDDEMANAIELAVDESCPEATIGGAVETRLNRVIEQLLPFAEGLGISRETVERFRLDTKLNDDAITLTLKKILPERVDVLIASHAIKNPPGLGGSFRHAVADPPFMLPALSHKLESSHLCIACNVKSSSLECVWRGSGDHWILAVVDFPGKKVHVYGNEGGHDENAKAMARNIGDFVNNHRIAKGLSAVCWKDPETHPVKR